MRKIAIAHRIHQAAGISKEQAGALLDEILELFKATLRKGDPIVITNFGKFTVRSKAPRRGRNPHTGEALRISPRRVVVFRASPDLTNEMNPVQLENREALTAIE